MAKIFITVDNGLEGIKSSIENFLKKNSGHRIALFQNQADFTIHIQKDTALGFKGVGLYIYDNNETINNLGRKITDTFKSNLIDSNYPKKINGEVEFPTLVFKACRLNDEVNQEQYGTLVAEAIIKFFNPEYEEILKHQQESERKSSKDKTYYDRAFGQNATSNSSLIFKKKS